MMAYLIKSCLVLFCGFVVLGAHAQEVEEEPVEQPAIVTSAIKLNTLYRGLPNPVEVAVPGVPCSELTVAISNGKIEGNGCAYWVWPGKDSKVLLTATWSSAQGEETAEAFFRVRDIPAPTACFAGSCEDYDSISVAVTRVVQGVLARLQDLDIGIRYEVLHYRLRLLRDCASVFDGATDGPKVSEPMADALQTAQSGDMIVISDIQVKWPDGREQVIAPLHLYVE